MGFYLIPQSVGDKVKDAAGSAKDKVKGAAGEKCIQVALYRSCTYSKAHIEMFIAQA